MSLSWNCKLINITNIRIKYLPLLEPTMELIKLLKRTIKAIVALLNERAISNYLSG